MAKIADNGEAVHVVGPDGRPLVLLPGDEVPDGVTVGEHALADEPDGDQGRKARSRRS